MRNADGVIPLIVFLMGTSFGTLLSRMWYPDDGYIADCAIGQDPALRETKGVASFEVTFKDGQWQTVTCLSEKSEAKE